MSCRSSANAAGVCLTNSPTCCTHTERQPHAHAQSSNTSAGLDSSAAAAAAIAATAARRGTHGCITHQKDIARHALHRVDGQRLQRMPPRALARLHHKLLKARVLRLQPRDRLATHCRPGDERFVHIHQLAVIHHHLPHRQRTNCPDPTATAAATAGGRSWRGAVATDRSGTGACQPAATAGRSILVPLTPCG